MPPGANGIMEVKNGGKKRQWNYGAAEKGLSNYSLWSGKLLPFRDIQHGERMAFEYAYNKRE